MWCFVIGCFASCLLPTAIRPCALLTIGVVAAAVREVLPPVFNGSRSRRKSTVNPFVLVLSALAWMVSSFTEPGAR